MPMIKPHWKFSRYLEGYGDLAEPLKRRDWTLIFWHLKGVTLTVLFAYFSTGDGAQAANQVKMAQKLKFTHSIRTPFVVAADFNMEPDQLWETGWVQSLGQKANIVVPEVEHTCTTGRARTIDFGVMPDSLQPFWRGITPELSSPCKPHIGTCLHFTATPTQVRMRQWCLRESASTQKPSLRNPSRERSSLSARPNTGILLCSVDARHKLVTRM